MKPDLRAMPWLNVRKSKEIVVRNVGYFDVSHLYKVYVLEQDRLSVEGPCKLFDAKGKELTPTKRTTPYWFGSAFQAWKHARVVSLPETPTKEN